jgi:hypothetical protein
MGLTDLAECFSVMPEGDLGFHLRYSRELVRLPPYDSSLETQLHRERTISKQKVQRTEKNG